MGFTTLLNACRERELRNACCPVSCYCGSVGASRQKAHQPAGRVTVTPVSKHPEPGNKRHDPLAPTKQFNNQFPFDSELEMHLWNLLGGARSW